MATQEIFQESRSRMEQSVQAFRNDLIKIRAGRANPAILDNIVVEAYGAQTPLNQVAGITVPEARLLLIQPWDKALLEPITHALSASNIGITPQSDGQVIRLPFPELNQERREQLVKQVGEFKERARVSVRNARRDAMDQSKKLEKDSEITEDELRTVEKKIQDLTDEFMSKLDELAKDKEKELMEI